MMWSYLSWFSLFPQMKLQHSWASNANLCILHALELAPNVHFETIRAA